jgi:hypothetical protein
MVNQITPRALPASDDNTDGEVGSGGVVILSTQAAGSNPQLLAQSDKAGTIYLLNRDNLGDYNTTKDQALHEFDSGGRQRGRVELPAYWEGYIYYWGENDHLKGWLTVCSPLQRRSGRRRTTASPVPLPRYQPTARPMERSGRSMRQHMSLLLHAHITYNGTTLTLTLTDTITNASFNHLDGGQYSRHGRCRHALCRLHRRYRRVDRYPVHLEPDLRRELGAAIIMRSIPQSVGRSRDTA